MSLPKGSFSVFIDNYFNSIPLIKCLKQEIIGCTGTVKASIWEDCFLRSKNKFKKQPKGDYQGHLEQNSGVKMVISNDSGAVAML